jgi:hypothetical protein
MNPAPAAIQTTQPLRTRTTIMADSSAALPTRIEIMRAGIWPASSVKGPLTITTADLAEFKRNFDAGVGIPAGLGKLPIDFSHEEWAQAAGWITGLEVEGDVLYATVEWSTSGAAALKGGEFKCISPSFWPACLGEWYDAEDSEVTARNVLVGAGLTNIPFFKDLTPIMASKSSANDEKSKNVIYINAERNTMTLDEIRVLDADKLTDEQKQFLTDNQAELSADERTKFGIAADEGAGNGEGEGDGGEGGEGDGEGDADPNKNNEGDAEVTDEVKEAVALQASVKKGEKVLMDASEVKAMKDQIAAHSGQLAGYRKAEIQASVRKHLQRGAIKADQVDKWVERIEADATLEDMLNDLPDNKVAASELGTEGAADVANAAKQFEDLVQAEIKASNGALGYGDAAKKVAAANPTLANDRQKQLTGKQ